jgi:hypothetical protein
MSIYQRAKRRKSKNHSEGFGLYLILSLETFTPVNSVRTKIYSKISSYGCPEQDSEIFYQRAVVEVRVGAGKSRDCV